jgi:tetratricopeptide (TPR) repeat protein
MQRFPRVTGQRLACGLILAGAAAAVSLLGFWREQSRPGIRHYLKGMEYLTARYPLQAEQEWLMGIREDPGEYHCYEQLGDYYTEVLQPQKAVDYYAGAAKRAPGNGSLFLRLTAAERKAGRRDEALATARRAAALLPDDADAVGLYGLLLAESRNRPAALAALRRAHTLKPEDRRYFIAMVNGALDTLDFAAAERDLQPYLRTHPQDAEAGYMIAVIYNQKPRTPGNLEAAIGYARQALAGMPNDARIHTLLGQLYLDSDRPGDALRVYTAGRRVAPNDEGILRGLMDCCRRLGKSAAVTATSGALQRVLARHDRIAHLTHVMGFNHHDTAAGLELARLVEEDGRFSQARAYYEQLVRQSPQDARTRRALSGFYRRMGRPEKARLALEPQFIP